jgi:hypothetical protein
MVKGHLFLFITSESDSRAATSTFSVFTLLFIICQTTSEYEQPQVLLMFSLYYLLFVRPHQKM